MPEQGLSLEISFEADRQLKRFLKNIPNYIGNGFDPAAIHATILYPEEIVRAGLGRQERNRLNEAAATISTEINDLDIVGRRVGVAPDILQPYKKFFGIEIIDNDG